MRVTQNMMNRSVVYWINDNMAELSKLNEQLSSGRRVNTLSDDVFATGRILQLERDGEEANAYMRNLDSVGTMLSLATSSLENASEIMTRAQELAVQAATQTYSDADLDTMAENVEGLLSAMVTLANIQYCGHYVFSGEGVDSTAYVASTSADGSIQSVVYQGEPRATQVAIGAATSSEMNLVGSSIFGGEADVFETLISLREAMHANDTDEIDRLIGELDTCHAGVSEAIGRLGGRQDELDFLRSSYEALIQRTDELKSSLWDADVAEVGVEYNTVMSRLQVVLEASAQAIQTSIINFL